MVSNNNRPFSILTDTRCSGATAGPLTAAPLRTSKQAPWNGQWIFPAINRPSSNGLAKCVHWLRYANGTPSAQQSRISIPPTTCRDIRLADNTITLSWSIQGILQLPNGDSIISTMLAARQCSANNVCYQILLPGCDLSRSESGA